MDDFIPGKWIHLNIEYNNPIAFHGGQTSFQVNRVQSLKSCEENDSKCKGQMNFTHGGIYTSKLVKTRTILLSVQVKGHVKVDRGENLKPL